MNGRRALPKAGCAALVALAAGLAGCEQDMSDLRADVERIKARPGGEIKPIPEIATFDSYSYPESPGRNPFARLSFAEPPEKTEKKARGGPNPDRTRQQEPLEAYPLDALTYVGTLQRQGQLWALIQAPGGTVHRVQTGNFMGENYGEIQAIKPSEVEVRELVSADRGGWRKQQATLALED